MSKAGLIDTPRRGVFVASPEGHKLLATNPQRIDNALLWNYPSFVAFRTHTDQADKAGSVKTEQATETASTLESEPQSTLDETIDAAHTALTTTLKADLLQRILDQPPDFFERLIINLLVAMGYGGSHRDAARNLGKSGDGGVDGVIDQDRLGLDQIYVQAKRYTTGTIGRPDVQGFVGSLVGRSASKGVFVTTTSFSKQAHDYVENLPQRVILVDGGRLCELMIEHDVGARVDRTITIKRLDEDFFLEN